MMMYGECHVTDKVPDHVTIPEVRQPVAATAIEDDEALFGPVIFIADNTLYRQSAS